MKGKCDIPAFILFPSQSYAAVRSMESNPHPTLKPDTLSHHQVLINAEPQRALLVPEFFL